MNKPYAFSAAYIHLLLVLFLMGGSAIAAPALSERDARDRINAIHADAEIIPLGRYKIAPSTPNGTAFDFKTKTILQHALNPIIHWADLGLISYFVINSDAQTPRDMRYGNQIHVSTTPKGKKFFVSNAIMGEMLVVPMCNGAVKRVVKVHTKEKGQTSLRAYIGRRRSNAHRRHCDT